MNNNGLNFNLENPIERGRLITEATKMFEGKILQTWGDCLTYVFDNICEAISFALYRVKEIDFKESITDCTIGNIGSADVFISMHTSIGWCTMKRLSSYEYKYHEEEATTTPPPSPMTENGEIEFFLSKRKEEFLNNLEAKSKLLTKEVISSKIFDSTETDTKISRMLDRYYGQGNWSRYWFTYKPISKIAVEVTLNISLLSPEATINLPLKDFESKKVTKYKKRGGGGRK